MRHRTVKDNEIDDLRSELRKAWLLLEDKDKEIERLQAELKAAYAINKWKEDSDG